MKPTDLLHLVGPNYSGSFFTELLDAGTIEITRDNQMTFQDSIRFDPLATLPQLSIQVTFPSVTQRV